MALQLLSDPRGDVQPSAAMQPRLGNQTAQLFVVEIDGVWFLKCRQHGAIAKAWSPDRLGPRRCRWCEV